MSRAVGITGFLQGRSLAEGMGEALAKRHDAVDMFTFSDDQDSIRKAVRRAQVYTHSAAFSAVVGTYPDIIHAFNPPIPTTRRRLLGRTLVKTAHMHAPGRGILEPGADARAVAKYDASTIAELAAHPIANLRPFFNGQISRFDAIQVAHNAASAEVPVRLITTDRDDYFQYGEFEEFKAAMLDIPFVRLEGEHDELPLHPEATLDAYYKALAQPKQ